MHKKRNFIILITVLSLVLILGLYTMINTSFTLISPEFSRTAVPIIVILVITILGSFLFGKYKEHVVDSSSNYTVDERNPDKNIFSSMNIKSKNKVMDLFEDKQSNSENTIKCQVCGHINKKDSIICEKCSNYLKK